MLQDDIVKNDNPRVPQRGFINVAVVAMMIPHVVDHAIVAAELREQLLSVDRAQKCQFRVHRPTSVCAIGVRDIHDDLLGLDQLIQNTGAVLPNSTAAVQRREPCDLHATNLSRIWSQRIWYRSRVAWAACPISWVRCRDDQSSSMPAANASAVGSRMRPFPPCSMTSSVPPESLSVRTGLLE